MNRPQQYSVSRETEEKIQNYIDHLILWNKAIRLTSNEFVDRLRYSYKAQIGSIAHLCNDGCTWADIGSGSGVPGLLIAISQPQLKKVFMIESDARKCAFLRSVNRALALNVSVVNQRVEHVTDIKADVISARAVAPLTDLLEISNDIVAMEGKHAYFKGSGWQEEHRNAQKRWAYDLSSDKVDEDGTVLLTLENVQRRS